MDEHDRAIRGLAGRGAVGERPHADEEPMEGSGAHHPRLVHVCHEIHSRPHSELPGLRDRRSRLVAVSVDKQRLEAAMLVDGPVVGRAVHPRLARGRQRDGRIHRPGCATTEPRGGILGRRAVAGGRECRVRATSEYGTTPVCQAAGSPHPAPAPTRPPARQRPADRESSSHLACPTAHSCWPFGTGTTRSSSARATRCAAPDAVSTTGHPRLHRRAAFNSRPVRPKISPSTPRRSPGCRVRLPRAKAARPRPRHRGHARRQRPAARP